MYCRNCGKQLPPQAEICAECGIRPPKGERFCSSCGTEVSPLVEICVKCGARLGKTPSPKRKMTAVLLAVFLGYWTWLYTYKRNAWKFWLALVLWIPSFIIFNLGIIPQNAIQYNANGDYIGLGRYRFSPEIVYLVTLIIIGLWIWAIVDTALKHNEWYWSYNWTAPPKIGPKGFGGE